MQPFHKKNQLDAILGCVHPTINAKDISNGFVARNADEKRTESKCMECHVTRERDELILKLFGLHEGADKRLAGLTHRQDEILEMILGGHPNKNIAADLHISQRTVENHRASIMKKTGAKSLPELTMLVLAADWSRWF